MKLRALKDQYINGGSILVKESEVFEVSCKACWKSLVANKMAEIVEDGEESKNIGQGTAFSSISEADDYEG